MAAGLVCGPSLGGPAYRLGYRRPENYTELLVAATRAGVEGEVEQNNEEVEAISRVTGEKVRSKAGKKFGKRGKRGKKGEGVVGGDGVEAGSEERAGSRAGRRTPGPPQQRRARSAAAGRPGTRCCTAPALLY